MAKEVTQEGQEVSVPSTFHSDIWLTNAPTVVPCRAQRERPTHHDGVLTAHLTVHLHSKAPSHETAKPSTAGATGMVDSSIQAMAAVLNGATASWHCHIRQPSTCAALWDLLLELPGLGLHIRTCRALH